MMLQSPGVHDYDTIWFDYELWVWLIYKYNESTMNNETLTYDSFITSYNYSFHSIVNSKKNRIELNKIKSAYLI